jgi:hypothetical protein
MVEEVGKRTRTGSNKNENETVIRCNNIKQDRAEVTPD